ncbi:MAG: hypothetical protein JNL58_24685 [Planctomyces sp.]|nr:hypothetical protein [Planctomyces sp.]
MSTALLNIPQNSFARLAPLSRIRVSGNDRQRFLHNFCTNEVKLLPSGEAVEAFFVDVRSRVLAHGWILAGDQNHEIWSIPGNEAALLKHLQKYVITEDVSFESLSESSVSFAIFSDDVASPLSLPVDSWPRQNCHHRTLPLPGSPNSPVVHVLKIVWAGVNILICSVNKDHAALFAKSLTSAGFSETNDLSFRQLRLAERWPVVGMDITDDHLAPEADRNSSAISYRKGCYLGQEPIARLDAMGHVNKSIRTLIVSGPASLLAGAQVQREGTGILGTVSSVEPLGDSLALVMGMIRTHGINLAAGLSVVDQNGNTLQASLP